MCVGQRGECSLDNKWSRQVQVNKLGWFGMSTPIEALASASMVVACDDPLALIPQLLSPLLPFLLRWPGQLTKLNLSSNRTIVDLPPSFVRLSKLTDLDLTRCCLQVRAGQNKAALIYARVPPIRSTLQQRGMSRCGGVAPSLTDAGEQQCRRRA